MTFEQLLRVIPESQEMFVNYEGYIVNGQEEAIGSMLGEDIYKGTVFSVEAEGDVLKVWVKEAGQ